MKIRSAAQNMLLYRLSTCSASEVRIFIHYLTHRSLKSRYRSVSVGPNSSHTVGPMRVSNIFVNDLRGFGILERVSGVAVRTSKPYNARYFAIFQSIHIPLSPRSVRERQYPVGNYKPLTHIGTAARFSNHFREISCTRNADIHHSRTAGV